MPTDPFIVSSHERFVDNLNTISNQLKGFYWFFLATIGAMGLAYKYILGRLSSYEVDLRGAEADIESIHGFVKTIIEVADKGETMNYSWVVLVVCLIGNIIFYKISEYAISQGFLFRYNQYRAAKLEFHAFGELNGDLESTVSDPTDRKMFIKDNRLNMGFFLPDQFNPLYWASLWLIVINSLVGAFITHIVESNFDWFRLFLIYAAISMPLIWKLWDYYLCRLKSFVSKYTDFKIFRNKDKNFLDFPRWCYLKCCLVVSFLLSVGYACMLYAKVIDISNIFTILFYWLLVIIVSYYLLAILIGFFIHMFRTFTHVIVILKKDAFSPELEKQVSQNPKQIQIKCGEFRQGVVLLAMVM